MPGALITASNGDDFQPVESFNGHPIVRIVFCLLSHYLNLRFQTGVINQLEMQLKSFMNVHMVHLQFGFKIIENDFPL